MGGAGSTSHHSAQSTEGPQEGRDTHRPQITRYGVTFPSLVSLAYDFSSSSHATSGLDPVLLTTGKFSVFSYFLPLPKTRETRNEAKAKGIRRSYE